MFHAFVRDFYGFITTFDAPGAGTGAYQGTLAFSINLEGATTGIYIDGKNVYHGFARSYQGDTVSFDPPGSVYTYPCQETCINYDGSIVGFYADAKSTVHGFVRDPDEKITTFDAPAAGTGNFKGTYAASINREGLIAGYTVDSKNVRCV